MSRRLFRHGFDICDRITLRIQETNTQSCVVVQNATEHYVGIFAVGVDLAEAELIELPDGRAEA